MRTTDAKRYAEIQEGDTAVLRVKVARANSEQAFIEFVSMEGPFSVRVPLTELTRTDVKPRRRGLPYGWWKSPEFWVALLVGVPTLALLVFILGAWFRAW